MRVVAAEQLKIPSFCEELGDFVRSGGILFYPTETLYGIGGYALDPQVISKILSLKGRGAAKGMSVLVTSLEQLDWLVHKVPERALELIEHFWPGPLTLILEGRDNLPQGLLSAQGSIAVRISSDPWAHRIVEGVGGPLTTTSANRSGQPESGQPAATDPEVVRRTFWGEAQAWLIDAGKLVSSPGSTVLDVRQTPWRLVRLGEIGMEKLISMGDIIDG